MMALAEELYPICRSITGNGVRQTLAILQRHLPLEVNEVPSGTEVLDWVVPCEWNIRDAYIARQDGTRIVDFGAGNLHVVQYSQPIDMIMLLAQLALTCIACPIRRIGSHIALPITRRTGVFVSPIASCRV